MWRPRARAPVHQQHRQQQPPQQQPLLSRLWPITMVLLGLLLHTAPRGVVLATSAAAAGGPKKGGRAAFVPFNAILQSVYNSKGGSTRRHVSAGAFFSSSSSSSCPARRTQRQQGRVLASVLNSNPTIQSAAASLSTKGVSPAVVKVLGDGEGGIKKPARDDRQYRMLWLQNGMQVREWIDRCRRAYVAVWLVAWLSSLIDATCGWLDGLFDRPTPQQQAGC